MQYRENERPIVRGRGGSRRICRKSEKGHEWVAGTPRNAFEERMQEWHRWPWEKKECRWILLMCKHCKRRQTKYETRNS